MTATDILRLGPCEVDLARHEVRRPQVVALTPLEVSFLRYLAARPGQAVSKEDLLEHVWGWKPTLQTRAVFHAVTRLRKKIEPEPETPRYLLAVFGVGYRLELPTAPDPAPTGRGAEWAALRAAFAGGAPLVTLVGPRGIGRSTLARRWLAEVPGSVAVDGAPGWPARLLASLGAREIARPEDVLPEALAHRRAALFDPAPDDPALALLGGAGSSVVVTAGAPLDRPGERVVTVGPLPLPADDDALARDVASVAVFLQAAERARPGLALTDADAPTVHAIVRATGGHPLALALAGGRLAVLGLDDLRALAGDAAAPGEDLERVLAGIWEGLDAGDRAALGALAAFPGGAPVGALVAASEDPDAVRRAERLVATGLVAASSPEEPPRETRFALPPPMRRFVALRAPPRTERRAARWLAALGDEASFEGLFGRDGNARRNRLAREASALAAAAAHAVDAWPEDRVALAIAAHHATWAGGPWAPALDAAERALAAGDDPGLRVVVARGRSWTGRAGAAALLEGALGDPAAGPLAREELGLAHLIAGRLAEAEAAFVEAVAALEDRPGRGMLARQHLSWVYRLQGRFDESRALILQLQAALDDVDHWFWPSLELDLAAVDVAAGRGGQATDRLAAAALALEAQGSRRRGLQAQRLRGTAALGARRWEEAERAFGEALTKERAQGDRRAVAGTFVNLGIAFAGQGRGAEATEAFERAAAGYAALGDRRGLGFARLNHGVSLRTTDPAAARRLLDDAVDAGRATGIPRLLGPALAERSLLEAEPGAARAMAEEAVALADRLEPALEGLARCARSAASPAHRGEDHRRLDALLATLDEAGAAELSARWDEATRR